MELMKKIDRHDRSVPPSSGMEVLTDIPDYYALLELEKSATQQEISNAYRYFAKRCHPAVVDQHTVAGIRERSDQFPAKRSQPVVFHQHTDVGIRERNDRLFVLYNEAFEVLGNEKSRAVYDFYGGKAARNGIFHDSFDFREGAFDKKNADDPEGFFRKFNYNHSVFPKILRQTTQLKNLLISRERDLDHEYETVALTVQELHLSLEELYNGGIKLIKNNQLVSDIFAAGFVSTDRQFLELKIVPGWTNGTRVLYPKMGPIHDCARPSDLIFEVVLDPHPRFRVENHDIYTTVQIPLADVMGIVPIHIEHLDGRKLSIGLTELASPYTAKVIKGEGLARDELKQSCGDLFVNFDIVFPDEIDPWQKLELWVALVEYPRPRPPLHYAISPISAISLQNSNAKQIPFDIPREPRPSPAEASE